MAKNARAGKLYGGYRRVSALGDRAEEDLRSGDLQAAAIDGAGERYGVRVRHYPVELDVSGSKVQRAILEEIIRAVERRELAGIIVPRLNRLARLKPRDRVELFERIESAGGEVISASEDLDASTPEGRWMRDTFLGLARMEWERYAEDFARAKQAALDSGKYLAKVAPIGYEFDGERRLVKSADAPAVLELFLMRAAGASATELVDYLAETTGKAYYRQSLDSIFRNKAYLGENWYRGKLQAKLHEAIVTEEQWRAAQRSGRKLKRSGTKSLLTGIATCASCGRGMGSDSSGSVPIYKCPRVRADRCAAPASITQRGLDAYVIEEVRRWAQGAGLEDKTREARPGDDALETARELLVRAEAALDQFAIDSADLRLSESAVRKGLEARQERVQEARERVHELETVSAVASVRTTLRALWPDLTTAERRQLIGAVLERVTVRRRERGVGLEERVQLVWRD